MRCRSINNNNIVWFNSLGLDLNSPVYDSSGKLLGYNSKKAKNFSDNQQAVSDSLTQRLSVIKGELWYKISYGLPLFDKIDSKVFMDTSVTSIIKSHPDVVNIESFSSNIVDKKYTFNCKILSKYGQITLNT